MFAADSPVAGGPFVLLEDVAVLATELLVEVGVAVLEDAVVVVDDTDVELEDVVVVPVVYAWPLIAST